MSVEAGLREVAEAVKPRLRGWLHAGAFPLALIGGLLLTAVAPTLSARIGAAVYTATAGLLFGVSGVYHRGNWSWRTGMMLRRFDHANIFVIIAGSYTPFAMILLPVDQARVLLTLVWGGAVLGVLFRVFWVSAPRWLYVPLYIALGWAAIFWLPAFAQYGGAAVVTLIIVGGLLYTLGATVYGTKLPNPSPRWFGFHEVFHALTLGGFVSHHIAAWLAAFEIGAPLGSIG